MIVSHNGLATPERKQKRFRSQNRGIMGSVPNFQRRLVWQVNWKYYELNKVMLLSRSLFTWCGLTISQIWLAVQVTLQQTNTILFGS